MPILFPVVSNEDSPGVEHISGPGELLSAFFMCLLTPKIALCVWSNFVPS